MGYVLEEGPHKATVDHITLDVEGTPVPAYHARPDGDALGGVVLVPDIFGLRPLMEDICRRLATHGLAVCAPETFTRLIRPRRDPRDRGAPGPGRRAPRRGRAGGPRRGGRPPGRRRRRGDGGGDGLLHGRLLHAQGRRHRTLRTGGGLLRHGPHAGDVGRRRPARRPRHRGRRLPDPGHLRRGRPPHPPGRRRRPPQRLGRASPTTRSSSTATPTTPSPTTRTGRSTGPTTPPTPGTGVWPSCSISRLLSEI